MCRRAHRRLLPAARLHAVGLQSFRIIPIGCVAEKQLILRAAMFLGVGRRPLVRCSLQRAVGCCCCLFHKAPDDPSTFDRCVESCTWRNRSHIIGDAALSSSKSHYCNRRRQGSAARRLPGSCTSDKRTRETVS